MGASVRIVNSPSGRSYTCCTAHLLVHRTMLKLTHCNFCAADKSCPHHPNPRPKQVTRTRAHIDADTGAILPAITYRSYDAGAKEPGSMPKVGSVVTL